MMSNVLKLHVYCKSKSNLLAECSIKTSEQFNTKFFQTLLKNHNILLHSIESLGGY